LDLDAESVWSGHSLSFVVRGLDNRYDICKAIVPYITRFQTIKVGTF